MEAKRNYCCIAESNFRQLFEELNELTYKVLDEIKDEQETKED